MLRSSLFLSLAFVVLIPAAHSFSIQKPIDAASLPRRLLARVLAAGVDETTDTQQWTQSQEYAAVSPGSHVRIQVGNVELARKAWKKRRRSGSPILIPCSVLNIDPKEMISSNIAYLIQKFGTPMSETNMKVLPEGYKGKDICLSMADLKQNYRKHLGSSLAKHASALGMETSNALIESLLTKEVQATLDVRLVSESDTTWLVTHMSRYRGHRLAEEAGLLQLDSQGLHTGMTRRKNSTGAVEFLPLSAALRVSQRAVDNGLVSEGSIHTAQVFCLDPLGDGGSPLLKLSMNTEQKMSKNKRIVEIVDPRLIQMQLKDLTVGAGPFLGKVTRVSKKSCSAFVDIGVGRSIKNGLVTKVLGMLRFDDLNKSGQTFMVDDLEKEDDEWEEEIDVIEDALNTMENDDDDDEDFDEDLNDIELDELLASSDDFDMFPNEEGEEDITHLVSLNDGILSYTDPETNEVITLGSTLDMDDDDDDDNESVAQAPGDHVQTEIAGRIYVKEGDEISVYIQAISKQSGRFMLTPRPVVQTMQEVKKETEADKKLSRMIAKMGGDISTILMLDGTECDGVIKATSKSGDWLYVQPHFKDLPVGVARVAEGISVGTLSQGDSVRIRLEGIDETRGQLAMTVIEKQ